LCPTSSPISIPNVCLQSCSINCIFILYIFFYCLSRVTFLFLVTSTNDASLLQSCSFNCTLLYKMMRCHSLSHYIVRKWRYFFILFLILRLRAVRDEDYFCK
jgi:hypothetical protein